MDHAAHARQVSGVSVRVRTIVLATAASALMAWCPRQLGRALTAAQVTAHSGKPGKIRQPAESCGDSGSLHRQRSSPCKRSN